MKILILGAGQVGSTVAMSLSSEQNDITIVDLDAEKLKELQDRRDLRGVLGFASHPKVLASAGVEDADMLIALTNSDEINMIACQVAYSLFDIPLTIARVRAAEYLNHKEVFSHEHIPVDVLISPEKLVTENINRLIEHPGALQVLDFADGTVKMVAMSAQVGSAMVGHKIADLNLGVHEQSEARVAAIFRDGESIPPTGKTVVKEGDIIYVLSTSKDAKMIMSKLRCDQEDYRRVMLAGGGNIGARLAQRLEKKLQVKVIERNPVRAAHISEQLEKSIVLVGDCADEELLNAEYIDQMDVFCALTDDNEANIVAAMLAKRLGAKKVIALINRPAYADLAESSSIDIAVSPEQITIGAVLTHVRRGHIVNVYSLRRGNAEAIEVVIEGGQDSSKVVGRKIEEIKFPKGTSLVGVVRDGTLIMPHHDLKINTGDHLILFISDKAQLAAVESLFSVQAMFL
ncbi:MAG: Trk system potassium transporter TrkA [bacterium]